MAFSLYDLVGSLIARAGILSLDVLVRFETWSGEFSLHGLPIGKSY